MRLPRDVGGDDLAKAVRIGTLAAVLGDVAQHFGITREALSERPKRERV